MNTGNIADTPSQSDTLFVKKNTTLQIPMSFDLSAYFDEPYNQTDGTDTECSVASVVEYWTRRKGRNFTKLDPSYVTQKTKSKSNRDCLTVALSGLQPQGATMDLTSMFTIDDMSRITTLDGILESISQWQPVLATINYFSAFDPRTATIPLPQPTEKPLGRMAVVIVGFDQNAQTLTLLNTLGNTSGENGYFTVPFSYINNIQDMWSTSCNV